MRRATLALLLAALILCAVPLPARAADGKANGGLVFLTDDNNIHYTAAFGPNGVVRSIEPPLPPDTSRLTVAGLVLTLPEPPAHDYGAYCFVNQQALHQAESFQQGLYVFTPDPATGAPSVLPVNNAFELFCRVNIAVPDDIQAHDLYIAVGLPPLPADDPDAGSLQGGYLFFTDDAGTAYTAIFDADGAIFDLDPPLSPSATRLTIDELSLEYAEPITSIEGARSSLNGQRTALLSFTDTGLLVFSASMPGEPIASTPVTGGAFQLECEARADVGGHLENRVFAITYGDTPEIPTAMADAMGGRMLLFTAPFGLAEDPGPAIDITFDRFGEVTHVTGSIPPGADTLYLLSLTLTFPLTATLPPDARIAANGNLLDGYMIDGNYHGLSMQQALPIPAAADGTFPITLDATVSVSGVPQYVHANVTIP